MTVKSNGIPYPPYAKRIHQIKCYNVGFGDCFLCKNPTTNSKMLIDCGTHRSFDNVGVTNDIYDELTVAKEKNLIISHLHQDHYNGISYLLVSHPDLKFDNIYLPNYISNGSLELYAAMMFYGEEDNPLSKAARSVLAIPGIFANNLSHKSKIYFVCEGKTFHNELCSFETILPKKWGKNLYYIDNNQIRDFCSRYQEILSIKSDNADCTTFEVRITENHRVQDQIDNLLIEYNNIEIPQISDDELKKLKKAFTHHHNNMSIAFHETEVCDDHNVMFLGDAERANIKYACDTYVSKTHYGFVKIPHHGTQAHFYKNLPSANYYAITNGNRHRTWEITSQYSDIYGDKSAFVCSNNANCQICQLGHTCKAISNNETVCGITLPSKTISI